MEEGKKLIILVDDNLANLRTGINVLSKSYKVSTAPSAKKLFELFLDLEKMYYFCIQN